MQQRKNENKDCYIVGIGASAGGLEALEKFFDNMPSNSGMAFVVVQHLSPDYKSMMVEILSKHTQMEVLQVEDGMIVEPNHIYLIPRKKNMTISHGKLYLTEKDLNRGFLNLPIDIFFQSLAQDQGEKAIAIVLSGTGSDGTRGIRAIKETDGMVIVQDENSAKFDGMPKSAISTDLVDYILLPEEMPAELLNYTHHPYISKRAKPEIVIRDEDTLPKILLAVKNQTGMDFSEYKHSTVVRRIQRRMGVNQFEKITDYLKYLQQCPPEVNILYRELLISVTKFFRDPEAFDVLRDIIIPKTFDRKNNKTTQDAIRIWVAGCSTGEEAYSIAMLFAEYAEKHEQMQDIKIFATDIDKDALEHASLGVYPESIVANVSLEQLQNFFIKKNDKYQVNRKIRQMVIFARHNILKDPPFAKMDLVTCRNLLIYLQPTLQEKLFSFFHFSLKDQGFLFLGNSETIGDNAYLFSTIDTKHRIYQYNAGYKTPAVAKVNLPLMNDKRVEYPLFPCIYDATKYMASRASLQKKLTEVIYQSLAKEYIPPFIVVNEKLEVIHVGGDINDYLKVPCSEMSFDLTRMLHDDFSTILRTAIYTVLKNQEKQLYNVNFKINDIYKNLNLHIKPLLASQDEAHLIAITFEEVKKLSSIDVVEKFDPQGNFNKYIADLERELQYTRESLQGAVEELGTSNEELQALNEELLTANEELQNTNEELQSVNEELVTVNSEYQYKIEELTDLSNDINNLLSSTHIGTVFLDKNLFVKRFTPDITKEIYLMEFDIGRPIQHISHNLQYTTLVEDICEVAQNNIHKKEVEVQSRQGKWYLLRILPYLTVEKENAGVVLTLVDITERRRSEESLSLLAAIAESLEEAIIGESLDSKIVSWNRGAERIFGYTAEEMQGRHINLLVPKELQAKIEGIIHWAKQGTHIERFETLFLNKVGHKIPVLFNVSTVKDAQGYIIGISMILCDISKYRLIEEKLHYETELTQQIMEISQEGIVVVNALGQIIAANRRAMELLILDTAGIHAGSYSAQAWQIIQAQTNLTNKNGSLPLQQLFTNQTISYDLRCVAQQSNGNSIVFSINVAPVLNQAGYVENVVLALKQLPHNQQHE